MTQEIRINPMHRAPRCSARSKRSGELCKAPAVKGWNVCRMHGARGGAPTGEQNGNYRHGVRTAESQAGVAIVKALAKLAGQTINGMTN